MSAEHTDTPETNALHHYLTQSPGAPMQRRYDEMLAFAGRREKERNEARIPLCVGKPIIQILAKEGQCLSDDKRGLIAADCLFRKDPYEELDQLRARVAELEKDKERLDWLDAQGMGQEPRVWSVYQFASNIRQAIDAAKGDVK